MQSTMSVKKKLLEIEENMTSDSRGLERSHNIGKEYAIENGIKVRMSDEEYNKEMTAIRIHLEVFMELL